MILSTTTLTRTTEPIDHESTPFLGLVFKHIILHTSHPITPGLERISSHHHDFNDHHDHEKRRWAAGATKCSLFYAESRVPNGKSSSHASHQPFAFILDAGFSLGTCFTFLTSGSASPVFSTMSTFPHQAQHPLSGARPEPGHSAGHHYQRSTLRRKHQSVRQNLSEVFLSGGHNFIRSFLIARSVLSEIYPYGPDICSCLCFLSLLLFPFPSTAPGGLLESLASQIPHELFPFPRLPYPSKTLGTNEDFFGCRNLRRDGFCCTRSESQR